MEIDFGRLQSYSSSSRLSYLWCVDSRPYACVSEWDIRLSVKERTRYSSCYRFRCFGCLKVKEAVMVVRNYPKTRKDYDTSRKQNSSYAQFEIISASNDNGILEWFQDTFSDRRIAFRAARLRLATFPTMMILGWGKMSSYATRLKYDAIRFSPAFRALTNGNAYAQLLLEHEWKTSVSCRSNTSCWPSLVSLSIRRDGWTQRGEVCKRRIFT